MAITTCAKCGGNGKYHYADRSTGVCFACSGSGSITLRPAPKTSARPISRERIILDLAGLIRNASDLSAEGVDAARGLLSIAPVDVRDRAVRAFAVAGVSL
jgi:hypothetical protein